MRIAVPTFLIISLLGLDPSAADVKVAQAEGVDLASYRSYAWGPGTPAARPEIQQAIVAAVDRELQSKGLRRVDQEADLLVVSVAYAEMSTAITGGYLNLDTVGVGVIRADVVDSTTGHLMLDLIDPRSSKPIWRSIASEPVSGNDVKKVLKKVDKIVRKMLEGFPSP